MEEKKRYRIRVENCLGTIIDVHKKAVSPFEDKLFLSQFEKLKEAINDMDMTNISEKDVLLVEQATNELLWEFKPVFDTRENDLPICDDIH